MLAAGQRSRDKSEVRGGEYRVNGNVTSIHAQPQMGSLATPRALFLEKNPLKLHLPRTWTISAQHSTCPLSCPAHGVTFPPCRSASKPSALSSPLPFPCSDRYRHASYYTTASSLLCHLPHEHLRIRLSSAP